MKLIFALSVHLLVVASITSAAENDETLSLVSSLLAKIEKLESKVMAASSSRKTRQASDSPCSEGDDSCATASSGGVTYVRWGNTTCPPSASIVYSGVVGGSWYTHHGAAVDPLCLPHDPQYLLHQNGYQGNAYLYGAEYEVSGPFDQSRERNVPCAVCEANGRTKKLMIPSHYECPLGWTREYYGYLMAGNRGHNAASKYTCMDESLAQISGSGGDTNGYLFYTVEAVCNQFIPCSDKELTCVVCTK